MPLEGPAAGRVELLGGFRWRHGGYETKMRGLQAERAFLPPFITKWVVPPPRATRVYLLYCIC